MDILCMPVARIACLAFFGSRHRPYLWSAETASTTSAGKSFAAAFVDPLQLLEAFRSDSIFLRGGFVWMPSKSKARVNPFQRVLGQSKTDRISGDGA